ncbi:hypothetical protein ACWD5V_40610, partial [Streptomyces sp. NPDC002523]
METQTGAGTDSPEGHETIEAPATRRRVRPLVAGAGALLCAAGLATVGVLYAARGGDGGGAEHHAPTVPAAYQVTGRGTAQISYAGADGKVHTVSAPLPWRAAAGLAGGGAPAGGGGGRGPQGGPPHCTGSRG